jgi:F-type H+-transporting ATPase subunit delta
MTAAATGPESDVSGTVFDESTAEHARTYADALINAAGDDAGAAVEELEEIVTDVLHGHPRLAAILGPSGPSIAEKDRILVEVFEGRASPIVVKFLRVLNRHGRLDLLEQIARQARLAWDKKQGRKPVTVRSATPLDDAQKAALEGRISALIGATPQLKLEVDPSLIGGLVVQVGDDVYDASVRTRLQQLRDRLIERKSHEIQSRRDHFSHPA